MREKLRYKRQSTNHLQRVCSRRYGPAWETSSYEPDTVLPHARMDASVACAQQTKTSLVEDDHSKNNLTTATTNCKCNCNRGTC